MKFSLVALFVASAIAAPQFGGGKGKSSGFPGFPTSLPSGFPTSGFPGFPTSGFPVPTGFPGFPSGSGFPFPTGGVENDGALFDAEEDSPARPTPTGKGKGGKGKGTGVPTGLPGFPTGLPTGLPGFPTGGFPIPTGRPGDDE